MSCWPELDASGVQAGDSLGNECRSCGHLVAIHSRSRGCVGCEMSALKDKLAVDVPEEMTG